MRRPRKATKQFKANSIKSIIEEIQKRIDKSGEALSGRGRNTQKLLLIFLVTLVISALFLTTYTIHDPSYKAGDVAVTDVKSPADITIDGVLIKRGEIVVREGERITDKGLEMVEAIQGLSPQSRPYLLVPGLFLLTMLLFGTIYHFSSRNIRKFSSRPKDLLFMATLLVSLLVLLRLATLSAQNMGSGLPSLPTALFLYLTPIAAGAMMVRLFLNSETAIIFAVISSTLAGMLLGNDLHIATYFLIGGVVAAMEVRHCIQRSTILKAGIILGIINSLVIAGISILQGTFFTQEILFTLPAGFVGGIVTAVIVTGLTPIFELAFGYTTNITLLELSRMDHPLLKELALKAPGTYHHSLIIGSLVEAAAQSIHANPLLARVSAYYHDIGKTKMPLYFVENMKGENRHNKLTPSMSSLILINHVKEGGEMALEYRLGDDIKNVIEQHHGTTLIRYFYGKAKEQEKPGMQQIKEKDFRYPGPKPQTKEAGLVMLADAIEAASKTLPDPSTAKIKGMVQKIINKIFTDGQLDECELTLRDLNAIAKSFNRVLDGIFHQRIDYPEPAYITKEDTVEHSAPQSPEKTDRGEEDKGDTKSGIRRLGA